MTWKFDLPKNVCAKRDGFEPYGIGETLMQGHQAPVMAFVCGFEQILCNQTVDPGTTGHLRIEHALPPFEQRIERRRRRPAWPNTFSDLQCLGGGDEVRTCFLLSHRIYEFF